MAKQAASSKQQAASSKQQAASSKQQAKIVGLLELVKRKLKVTNSRHPVLDTGSRDIISVQICSSRPRYKNGVTSHWSVIPTLRQAAFTLVELAIVLVIIGLLVGGVLVGKDLISAAEVRAQVSQIEKYNAAVHTFQTKYDGLPGDLAATKAAAFGLFASTAASGFGHVYENGVIITYSSNVSFLAGEPLIFWRHLSEAKLIDGSYSATTGTAAGNITADGAVAVTPTSVAMINAHLPPAKIGRGASIMVGALNYKPPHYYVIAGIKATNGSLFTGSTNSLTAQEAYNIDNKLDDGNPLTGSVLASDEATGGISPIPGFILTPLTTCVSSGAYVVGGTTLDCSLQIRFQ